MYWLKRNKWKAGIAIASLLLLLIFMVWVPMSAGAYEGVSGPVTPVSATVQATPTIDATMTALSKEKLKLDVDQEQRTYTNWIWSNAAPFLSAYIGVIAGLFTFYRGTTDQRQQREDERKKQLEERFKSIVEGLGSTNPASQVSSGIILRSFLSPDYEQFHNQVFALAVVNLRLRNHDPNIPEPLDPLSQELVIVFKESYLLTRDKLSEEDYRLLDQIQLDSVYLAQADLRSIRMRKASLRGADLSGADLSNANLMRSDLSGANIENARSLQGTDLRGVIGLTKEQKDACKAKNAIIDDDTTIVNGVVVN